MTDAERLAKAQSKITARQKHQAENGFILPSPLEYFIQDALHPIFRNAVGLLYPKSGGILLGEVQRKDITRLTKEHPTIYAIKHSGVLDVARLIAYALPHVTVISGDERAFYCTLNEHLFKINGVQHFERTNPADRRLIVERASAILSSGSVLEKHHAILQAPEAAPNVYGREVKDLFPGIVIEALNTGGYIVPVGNTIHIIRDPKTDKIIGDINYMSYEHYLSGQTLFRPSEDQDLARMHRHLQKISYQDAAFNRTDIEYFVATGEFRLGNISFNLEDKAIEFLNSHPILKAFIAELANHHEVDMDEIFNYIKRCAVIKELNRRQVACLNVVQNRMVTLTDEISDEIDRRHPLSQAERERNHQDYVQFYLDTVEKVGKKGPSTINEEIDRHFNTVTDERIIASETKKVLTGLEQILLQNKAVYQQCYDRSGAFTLEKTKSQ